MRLVSMLAGVLTSLWVPVGADPENRDRAARLFILDRQISQQNSRWTVRYQVRYDGDQPLELSASDVTVDYEAWVANSRCRPHTVPRKSEAHFSLAETNLALATVIANSNERLRCREKIALTLTAGAEPVEDSALPKKDFLPIRLSPQQTLWLYLTVEHDHFLHGTYDPLLGERKVEIRLGPYRVRDSIPLNQEQAPAMPLVKLSTPQKERLDERQFHSAPDSLFLAADVPGYQYFRFDDMPVRYGTTFRLSFWYLVAYGTEGTCHVRVMEYQDTPNAWKRLDNGGFDEAITVQGRWQRFEQTFCTLDETTTMALDFRITGANVGELWIDDVELVPVHEVTASRRAAGRELRIGTRATDTLKR